MDIIIVLKNGIATEDSPYVFKRPEKAEAFYEQLCRKYLGDDFDDVYGVLDDFTYGRVNTYLMGLGYEIQYFTGVPML